MFLKFNDRSQVFVEKYRQTDRQNYLFQKGNVETWESKELAEGFEECLVMSAFEFSGQMKMAKFS
jgi:hypothetical protein